MTIYLYLIDLNLGGNAVTRPDLNCKNRLDYSITSTSEDRKQTRKQTLCVGGACKISLLKLCVGKKQFAEL